METKELVEIYKSLFETWRFEVNSHWQRSSYFAAFETVAVGADWKLLGYFSAIPLSILGICLTIIWFLNNEKTHFYAVYWLQKVSKIESKLLQRGEADIDFAAQILGRPRDKVRHRHLVRAVPAIFLIAWLILLSFAIYRWLYPSGQIGVIASANARNMLTFQFISLAVAIGSLLVATAATWIARNSLLQARELATREHEEWRQRKWFDLYFEADAAYDEFDRFQTLYPNTDAPSWGTAQWEHDWNHLMTVMRRVNGMAVVFPVNSAIDKLLSATSAFKNPEEAVSKERLKKLFDAVEDLRQRARLNTSVLQ